MKKILLVLVIMTGTVFLGQPATAAEGDEAVDPVVVSSTEAAAQEPAAVEPAAEPAEEAAPDEEQAETPAEPADEVVPEPEAADETSKAAPSGAAEAPADEAADAPAGETVPSQQAQDSTQSQKDGGSSVSAAAAPAKVFVCKYVGKPGVDERLKAGKNPISVSSSSTGGAVVGNYFADGQDRSYVVAIDTGQPDPSVTLCPAGVSLTTVIPVAPIVSPATCFAAGTLTLPTATGVAYSVSPAYTGLPGTYTVTATALAGFVLDPAVTVPFPTVVIDAQLTAGCQPPPVGIKKVWVCKYVGTPGTNEVLKGGKNPIEVSVNALPGAPVNPQVGDVFSDAQERSVVVALSPANPEPTVADCPPAIVPNTDVTAAGPTVDPATCLADGVLTIPTTAGVTYTQAPLGSGPGTYVVTAVADATFTLIGTSVFPVTVQPRLTDASCGAGGGTNDPGTGSGTDDPGEGSGGGSDDGGEGDIPVVFTPTQAGLLPNTGGTPLWMLLLGGSLTAAGVIILMGNRKVVHAYSSGAGPLYSLILPPVAVAPVALIAAPAPRGLRGVLASVVSGARRLLGGRG